jgi:hypothetical protein
MNAQTEMTALQQVSRIIEALAEIVKLGDQSKREDDPEVILRHPVMTQVIRIREAASAIAAHLTKPDAGGGEESDIFGWVARDTLLNGAWIFHKNDAPEVEEILRKRSFDNYEIVALCKAPPSGVPVEPGPLEILSQHFKEEAIRNLTPLKTCKTSDKARAGFGAVEIEVQPLYVTVETAQAYADARVSEATRELVDGIHQGLSVCRSVATGKSRRIQRDGCTMYAQTDEWCKWLEDEIAPQLEALIAKYTQTQKESK